MKNDPQKRYESAICEPGLDLYWRWEKIVKDIIVTIDKIRMWTCRLKCCIYLKFPGFDYHTVVMQKKSLFLVNIHIKH